MLAESHGRIAGLAAHRLDSGRRRAACGRLHCGGCGGTAAAVDLRQWEEVDAWVDALPALDILISTPSINVRQPMLHLTEQDFDRIAGLNPRRTFSLLRAGGRRMAAAGRGSMIVFSSIRSQVIEPGQSLYAATKAGTVQRVRTLAAELGPSAARANAVAPGVVDTPLTAPIKQNPQWYQAYADKSILKRWARADEMAGAVVFLASDASSYVTGTLLFVDGGWTAADGRFMPPL